MWAQTGFSFARASVQQEVAFVGFAIFYDRVLYLARSAGA